MAAQPVPAVLAVVGDVVICKGELATVTRVSTFAEGDEIVRRVRTPLGVRRFAHRLGGAYRGAEILGQYPAGVVFEMEQ